MKPNPLLCLILCMLPMTVSAYTFQFMLMKDPVHTDMSIKAWQCVMEYPDTNGFDCDNYTPKEGLPETLTINANQLTIDKSDIYYASIWADDPIRELRKRKFHRAILWTIRLVGDKCRNLKDGLPDGLRCTAHYGSMQFMHAMESENQLPAMQTHAAILEWLRFAYEVASNKQNASGKHFTEQKHCDYFNVDSPSKFQQSMLPRGASGFPCSDDMERPWSVGTIFSFNCWFRSESCWEYTGTNHPMVRKAALGAILHAVQDSYAQGHTSRGNTSEELINQIDCAPIEQFQNYSLQNHDQHGKADKTPTLGPSCLEDGNPIHGPVTASAEILRLFSQNATPDEVLNYLTNHVFVLAANNKLKLAGTSVLMRKND